MKKPEELPYEELYRLYVTEHRGVIETARILKCRNDVVSAALNLHGLARSNYGTTPKPPTKEWFLNEYVHKERSIEDICQELGLEDASIRHHLRKYQIPIRYRSRGRLINDLLNDKEWLYDQYVTQLHSIHTIADAVGCRSSSVVRALAKHGILREKGAQGKWGESRRRQFTGKRREAILERDNYQCRYPECSSTVNLELHHIIPIAMGGRDDVDNGITLCKLHHRGMAAREEDYIELFLSIIYQEPLA